MRDAPNQSLQIITNADKWDTWLCRQNAHILQSFAWGEFKARFGWRVERMMWRQGDTIQAAAQILYRRLAPTLTLAYIPRGPAIPETESVMPFLEHLQQHVRTRGVFLLKLEPNWQRHDPRTSLLAPAGFHSSPETIQPPATIQMDLTAHLEQILERMKAKWRYNIRLSERKGIHVRTGMLADIPAFYELLQTTGERDHFAIHSMNYYREAFELLAARDAVRLFIAEFENKPLAMIFVTAFGDEAIYLYGASSNIERNRMPNHALHWAAIQWAKARGCKTYDLWGIPEKTEEASEDSDLPSSLYQFKQGFGGQVVHYAGAWDQIYNPLLYRLYRAAREFRKTGE
ncbi:MAG TPA: peptidoglycan bridge formation glycyltransferase FemA/FemB family protein [Anaerolineae bacterium]|nr:peptidoglycan bridge formation glycyltransferase FemA/FemB family protein [Anaerolineae bacterium]